MTEQVDLDELDRLYSGGKKRPWIFFSESDSDRKLVLYLINNGEALSAELRAARAENTKMREALEKRALGKDEP